MLGRKLFTVSRTTGAYVNSRWVASVPTTFSILSSLQPLSGEELQALEENRRAQTTYKMYTDIELYTAKAGESPRNPDKLTVYDETYEVINVYSFQSGIISHFKVIISKVTQ
jgi:hypothetical protein